MKGVNKYVPVFQRQIAAALLSITAICTACSGISGKSFVPDAPQFREKDRQMFILPEPLLEISGIVHIGGDTMAAVNDEEGVLYFMQTGTDSITTVPFGEVGDYEDITRAENRFFIVRSDGDVIEFSGVRGDTAVRYKFPGGKKIEFESIVHHPAGRQLILLTKDQRKKEDGVSAYSFHLPSRQFSKDPLFTIPLKLILTKLQNFSADCKPSGAAIHPISGKLYLIASVGKLLLECTTDGKVEKIFKLNPSHFPQPEGITFATNGDMYVANEGLHGKATILKFPYARAK